MSSREASVAGDGGPDAATGPLEGLSIADAARILGVSERTVYRKLRKGELKRVSASDRSVRVSDVGAQKTPPRTLNSVDTVGIVSDFVGDSVSQLIDQLALRDAQIAQLLATQQELTRTVQRMQEQIFELACLVVRHGRDSDTGAQTSSPRPERTGSALQELKELFGFGKRRTDRPVE